MTTMKNSPRQAEATEVTTSAGGAGNARRSCSAPKLTVYGDLAALTRGLGVGDDDGLNGSV